MTTRQQRATAIAALSDVTLDAMLSTDHPGMERLRAEVLDGLLDVVDIADLRWEPERWDGLS